MRQIMVGFSRIASSAAVVFAFLFALDYSLHAQLPPGSQLIVFDFGLGGVLKFFDANGPISSIAAPPGGAGVGGEGVACLAGGAIKIFVANNSGTIYTFDSGTGLFTVFATASDAHFASLALSPDGSTLYAAGRFNNSLYGFSTTSGLQISGSPSPPAGGTPGTMSPLTRVAPTCSRPIVALPMAWQGLTSP